MRHREGGPCWARSIKVFLFSLRLPSLFRPFFFFAFLHEGAELHFTAIVFPRRNQQIGGNVVLEAEIREVRRSWNPEMEARPG